MKKLMIAAAVACMAAFAQAASYNWSGKSSWISADGEHGLSGKSVYFFNTADIAKSALLANLTMDNIEYYALLLTGSEDYATTGNDGEFNVNGIADGFEAGAKGTVASAYALLLDDDNSGNTWAYAIDSPSVTITDSHVSGMKIPFTFNADNIGSAGSLGWTQVVQDVPEPTSGLLLLLGMGALALRRRRV